MTTPETRPATHETRPARPSGLTSLRDPSFEAAYLHAGRLVGLIHEQDLPSWEEASIDASSPMRDAPRELASGGENERIVDALLCTLSHDSRQTPHPVSTIVRVLSDMRRELRCAAALSDSITAFADRWMLAEAGVNGAVSPSHPELVSWLDGVRRPSFFLFQFEHREEAAAFAAAVSRAVLRKGRRWDSPNNAAACAWRPRQAAAEAQIVANEAAWAVARDAFSPLPLTSRIPYPGLEFDGRQLFDGSRLEPLGAEAAFARAFER